MAFYVPWLVDAARLTGYPVVAVGGWQSHGHGGMRVVEGVVAHHTADGPRGNYPSLNVVRNGRAGLRGPLSQFGLGRDGTVYVIAAGLSYHAGASDWAGFRDLNDEFLGIEAESVGTRDDWTPQQRDCYPRLVAALLYYMKRPASRLGAHKEVCRPRGRKIDPAYWDMNAMRATVDNMLRDPLRRIPRGGTSPGPTPTPTPTTPTRKKDNVLENYRVKGQGVMRLNCPVGKASGVLARAWLCASTDGPEAGHVKFWFQHDGGGISEGEWWLNMKNGLSERQWAELPDGATMVNIHYNFPNGGCITLEGLSK